MKILILTLLLLGVYTAAEVKSADTPSFHGVQPFSSVDGEWSDFSDWGTCSRTCGKGTQTRVRTCTNPPPRNGGKMCIGHASEHRPCIIKGCPGVIMNIYFPIDGGWSDFSEWTKCSKSCGGGVQKRRRTCSNPYPSNGGNSCIGKDEEIKPCSEQQCAVNGEWTDFSDWSACSRSCDGGIQTRSRSCTNPAPQYGGKRCSGPGEESRRCNEEPCSDNDRSSPTHGWSARMEERFGLHKGTAADEQKKETDSSLYETYGMDSKNISIKEVTTMPARFNSLSPDANLRRRRKKRSDRSTHSSGDTNGRSEAQFQSGCTPKPFWLSLTFYFAISGWGCFAIAVGMFISFKWRCGQRYREFKDWQENRRRRRSGDAESTNIDKSTLHPKKPRHRTEDQLEVISETDIEDGRDMSLTPKEFNQEYQGASRHDGKHDKHVANRRKIIKKVALDHNDNDLHVEIQYPTSASSGASDREKNGRKSGRKRSIIKGHDSMNRRHSLVDELLYARSVIMYSDQDRQHNRKMNENRKLIKRKSMGHTGGLTEDLLQYAAHVIVHDEYEKQHDHQAKEKRRVIKEVMANKRRGSLLEDLQFAKSVINPDSHVRYLDRDAQERRQRIKATHESTRRRMSLKDDLLIAQAIIAPKRMDEDNTKAIADANISVDTYDYCKSSAF